LDHRKNSNSIFQAKQAYTTAGRYRLEKNYVKPVRASLVSFEKLKKPQCISQSSARMEKEFIVGHNLERENTKPEEPNTSPIGRPSD
jgi:hypothetical protein